MRCTDLLWLQGGERYRSRAFWRIGRVLEQLAEPVASMIRKGTLEKLPDIGDGSASSKKMSAMFFIQHHAALRTPASHGVLHSDHRCTNSTTTAGCLAFGCARLTPTRRFVGRFVGPAHCARCPLLPMRGDSALCKMCTWRMFVKLAC